jgi:NADPH-dependent curcumin reductase CurA
MSRPVNRRIVLAARPSGAPTAGSFRLEQRPVPELADGQVLLRTVYLSLDPYMRGRMSDAPSYAPPVAIDDVMVGATVSRIEESRHGAFAIGDLVLSFSGWQELAVTSGGAIMKLDARIPKPTYALGVLGMPGFTAYVGLLDIGNPQPGETVVVAAATGAVGAVVGQLAAIRGARAVGIAGGPEKCAFAREVFGFDACIDHRDPKFGEKLADACPKGVDVYFENVGGRVLEAVLPRLNDFARIPVCGVISRYNAEGPAPGPDRTDELLMAVVRKRLRLQGFIILDHDARRPQFFADMLTWVRDGRVKTREDIVSGLENAPGALLRLLGGKNFGKVIVQVSEAGASPSQ